MCPLTHTNIHPPIHTHTQYTLYLQRTEQAWKQMRWIEDAVQKGRDVSAGVETLLPLRQLRDAVKSHPPNGLTIKRSEDRKKSYMPHTLDCMQGENALFYKWQIHSWCKPLNIDQAHVVRADYVIRMFTLRHHGNDVIAVDIRLWLLLQTINFTLINIGAMRISLTEGRQSRSVFG